MRKCNFESVDCLMVPCVDRLNADVKRLLYIVQNFVKKIFLLQCEDFYNTKTNVRFVSLHVVSHVLGS